jgi:hypothetical protein
VRSSPPAITESVRYLLGGPQQVSSSIYTEILIALNVCLLTQVGLEVQAVTDGYGASGIAFRARHELVET